MSTAREALERISEDDLLSLLEVSTGLMGEMIDDELMSRMSQDGHANGWRRAKLMETLLDEGGGDYE